jgi:outer membrane protein
LLLLALLDSPPLSLPAAVQQALAHNPAIQTSQAAVAQARAQLHLTEVPWFPSASLDLSGNETAPSEQGHFGEPFQSNTADASIRQTVSDFGRTHTAVAAAQDSLQAAQASLQSQQQSVALTVETQYFTVLANEELVDIAQDSVRDQQKHVEQTQAFYQQGVKAKLDVAQAQTSLASSQLALVQAENARDQAYVSLNTAMGLRSATPAHLDKTLLERAPTSPDVDPLLQEAWASRPDVLALQAQLAASRADLDLARLGLNPTLSGQGSVNVLNQSTQNNPSWTVSMALNVPLLDGHQTRSQIELAQANLQSLQSQSETLHDTVFQQVQNDVLAFKAAVRSVQVNRTGVESAAEAFHLADARYEVGLGSSVDYLDAHLAYVQARSALVSAEAAQQESQAQLEHDVGNILTQLEGK